MFVLCSHLQGKGKPDIQLLNKFATLGDHMTKFRTWSHTTSLHLPSLCLPSLLSLCPPYGSHVTITAGSKATTLEMNKSYMLKTVRN